MPLIAVDQSSRRENSTLPVMKGEVVLDWLERETGADFMLSALSLRCHTVSQLKAHIAAGALLVQHKSGTDLPNSFGTRLAEAQCRMKAADARHAQTVLLYTGQWWAQEVNTDKGKKLHAFLNGVDMGFEYSNLAGALAAWGMRGGWHHNLPGDGMIPGWAALMLAGLEKAAAEPVRQVWPERETMQEVGESPLQLLQTVTDGRVVLVSIPGVGPTLANWLWEVSGHKISTCLTMLTDAELLKGDYVPHKPRNYGPALIESTRKFFNLGTYEALGLVNPDEIPF